MSKEATAVKEDEKEKVEKSKTDEEKSKIEKSKSVKGGQEDIEPKEKEEKGKGTGEEQPPKLLDEIPPEKRLKEKPCGIYKAFNCNSYATKKTIAEGMLDVSLLLANVSLFKALIELQSRTPLEWIVIAMLVLSVLLQIAVGVLLVSMGFTNVNNEKHHDQLICMSNSATLLVFFITVINVMVSALWTSSGSPKGISPQLNLPENSGT